MIPDDSILDMIATEVHGAAERNLSRPSERLPLGRDMNAGAFAGGAGGGSEQIAFVAAAASSDRNLRYPIPDRNEILRVRCANCDQLFYRRSWVIETQTTRYGFFACRKACRAEQLAKNERLLVPMREEAG